MIFLIKANVLIICYVKCAYYTCVNWFHVLVADGQSQG